MAPPPDPIIQAAIDADFHPVDIKFGPPENFVVLSGVNSSEKDLENNLDFTGLNRLTKLLVTNPNIRCPPPPNVVSQKLSGAINNTKEEGNVRASLMVIIGCQLKSILDSLQSKTIRESDPTLHDGGTYCSAASAMGDEPSDEGRALYNPLQ